MVPALELGRDAVKRHAWTEAKEAFAAADRADALAAEDLELMGEAAWWAAKSDEAADRQPDRVAGVSGADLQLRAFRRVRRRHDESDRGSAHPVNQCSLRRRARQRLPVS